MSRYRFRLATVLRVRRMEEEAAKLELQAANRALRGAAEARLVAEERYRVRAGRQMGASAADLHAERLEAGLLAEQLSGAGREVSERERGVAQAQARWSAAAQRVAVLERLDARRKSEHEAGELRAEVARIDDIVTARYVAEYGEPELAASAPGGDR